MKTTGDILRNRRLELGLTSQNIADKIDVSQSYVNFVETNKKNPSVRFLEEISKILDLTNEDKKDIEEYEKFRRLPEEYQNKLLNLTKVVKGNTRMLSEDDFMEICVRAKASAGNGYINLEECLYTTRIRKNGYHKNCYIIEVVGNSMEPLIQDGAYVIVDPEQTSYIKDKVYVVKSGEEVYIKKVEIDEKSNFMILKSVNQDHGNKYIPEAESHLVKILGRAIGYTYEGKL